MPVAEKDRLRANVTAALQVLSEGQLQVQLDWNEFQLGWNEFQLGWNEFVWCNQNYLNSGVPLWLRIRAAKLLDSMDFRVW